MIPDKGSPDCLEYSVFPNIVGSFFSVGSAAGGCFTSGASSFFVEEGTVYGAYKKTFAASNSSSIYKDDVTTVRPDSLRMLALVRAY